MECFLRYTYSDKKNLYEKDLFYNIHLACWVVVRMF